MAAEFQLYEIALIASSILILCAAAVLCVLGQLRSQKPAKTANRRSRRLRNPSDLEAGFHDEILSCPSPTRSSLRSEAVRGPATRPLPVHTIQDEKDIWWPVYSLSSHPAFPDVVPGPATRSLPVSTIQDEKAIQGPVCSLSSHPAFRDSKSSGSTTALKSPNTTTSPPWIAINADDPSDWKTETTKSILSRRGSWPLQSSTPRTRAQSPSKKANAPKRWLVYEHHPSGTKLVKVCWDDEMKRKKKAKTASEADSKAFSAPFYVNSPPHEGPRRERPPSWLSSTL